MNIAEFVLVVDRWPETLQVRVLSFSSESLQNERFNHIVRGQAVTHKRCEVIVSAAFGLIDLVWTMRATLRVV